MNPIHPTAHFTSHKTFEQLYRSFRPFDPRGSYEGSFDCIRKWSEVMQQASVLLCISGTNIAVDDCIQHFEGITHEKVIIKSKPTLEGFKI
jgi:hypothetical protein